MSLKAIVLLYLLVGMSREEERTGEGTTKTAVSGKEKSKAVGGPHRE